MKVLVLNENGTLTENNVKLTSLQKKKEYNQILTSGFCKKITKKNTKLNTKYTTIYNWVHPNNWHTLKWLQYCGFEAKLKHKYGVKNEDFILIMRTK